MKRVSTSFRESKYAERLSVAMNGLAGRAFEIECNFGSLKGANCARIDTARVIVPVKCADRDACQQQRQHEYRGSPEESEAPVLKRRFHLPSLSLKYAMQTVAIQISIMLLTSLLCI